MELLNGVTKKDFDRSFGVIARRKVDMKIPFKAQENEVGIHERGNFQFDDPPCFFQSEKHSFND